MNIISSVIQLHPRRKEGRARWVWDNNAVPADLWCFPLQLGPRYRIEADKF